MAKKKECQKSAVLDYLKKGHTLTTIEASRMFGCTRLPARIADYKKEGYKIADIWMDGKTRYGTPTRYKAYKLIEQGE